MTGLTNVDENNGNEGLANGAHDSAVAGGDDGVSGAAGRRDGDSRKVDGGIAYALAAETSYARNLLADMRDLLGDDGDLIVTAVEGETELAEIASKAVERIIELERMLDVIDGMQARLSARAERFKKQHGNLKEALCVAMETGCIKRLETPLATASLRAVPPKAEIIDEAAIPARFWKPQEPKLDKKAVLDALKAKEPVPGATLSNGGMTVSIKAS